MIYNEYADDEHHFNVLLLVLLMATVTFVTKQLVHKQKQATGTKGVGARYMWGPVKASSSGGQQLATHKYVTSA